MMGGGTMGTSTIPHMETKEFSAENFLELGA